MRISLLALALLLPACSGSSGGSTTAMPSSNSVSLVIATDTESDTGMTALVQGIVLEEPNGRLTENLLGTPREVSLADPLGRADVIDLEGVEPGVYTSVHLIIAPRGVIAQMGDGQEREVAFAGPDIEIPFETNAHIKQARHEYWSVTHDARLDLRMDNRGIPNWRPNLVCGPHRELPLRHAHVTVTAIDAGNFTMEGLLRPERGTFPITMVFTDDSVLADKTTRALLTKEQFFNMVSVGDRITVEGMMTLDNVLTITLGILRTDPRDKDENEVVGRVLSVNPANQSFEMQVLEVISGIAVPRIDRLPILTVDASNADIEHEDLPTCDHPVSSIVEGDIVTVEWTARRVRGGRISAKTVTVHASEQNTTEGIVSRVPSAADHILAAPRGDAPLTVNGIPVPQADIRIDGDTIIYRGHPTNEIDATDIKVGERIEVWGTPVDSQRVDASVIAVLN